MEIQIGKYTTRGGNIVEVTHVDAGMGHPKTKIVVGEINGIEETWDGEGTFHRGSDRISDWDMVERLPDEAAPKVPGQDFVEKDKTIHDFGGRELPEAKHEARQEFKLTGTDQTERNRLAEEVMKHVILRGDALDVEQVVTVSFLIAEKMVIRGKL